MISLSLSLSLSLSSSYSFVNEVVIIRIVLFILRWCGC